MRTLGELARDLRCMVDVESIRHRIMAKPSAEERKALQAELVDALQAEETRPQNGLVVGRIIFRRGSRK